MTRLNFDISASAPSRRTSLDDHRLRLAGGARELNDVDTSDAVSESSSGSSERAQLLDNPRNALQLQLGADVARRAVEAHPHLRDALRARWTEIHENAEQFPIPPSNFDRALVSDDAVKRAARSALSESSASKPLNELQEAAERNDVDAQYELGRRYEHGIGVDQSSAKADAHYFKAAAQGHAAAHLAVKRLEPRAPYRISTGHAVVKAPSMYDEIFSRANSVN